MHSTLTNIVVSAIFVFSVAGSSGSLLAQHSNNSLTIQGYSPVSYFEHDRAEKGSPEFSATYNQRTYQFTSAEQLARFEANPQRYEPMFPHHCPYNLALGRQAAIDPKNFKIVNGNLLLFHYSEDMDGLEQWNAHDDEDELLERAKAQYTLFRF